MTLLKVLFRAAHRWYDLDAGVLAAALAYYTPFALTPLIFVSVSVLSVVYGSAYTVNTFLAWGDVLGPDIVSLLRGALTNIRNDASSSLVALFGAVFFLGMVIIAFNTLISGFHHLWEVPHSGIRGWLRKCWRSLVFVVVLQAYLLVALAAEGVFSQPGFAVLPHIASAVSAITTILLFYLMYRFLTLRPPSRTAAFVGAVVATFLLLIAQQLIGFYVNTASATKIYDAAGLIVALLIWIYATAAITYYGAAVVYEYDRARRISS